jgi:hypothetical protein
VTDTKQLLKEGDIIELQPGHTVYADIPNSVARGDFRLSHRETDIKEFAYLAGRYIVVKTSLDGGGPCFDGTPFSDGHHVYCERLTDRMKVDFYQTGAFTAMIRNIEPVAKGKLLWVEN